MGAGVTYPAAFPRRGTPAAPLLTLGAVVGRRRLLQFTAKWTGWDLNPRQAGNPRLRDSPRGQGGVPPHLRTGGASGVLFDARQRSALRPSRQGRITAAELSPPFSRTELPALSINAGSSGVFGRPGSSRLGVRSQSRSLYGRAESQCWPLPSERHYLRTYSTVCGASSIKPASRGRMKRRGRDLSRGFPTGRDAR
jgi:hypothetical protein